MYRLSTQMDMSFSTIAQWENSFPLNALVPCSIPTQAASGRRPEVDETEYWRKSLFKGNRASSSRTLFSSSSLRLAFAPLIFASRLCASHLCVSPLRLSSLRLAFAPLSSLRLAFTAPPLRLAICASPLFPLGHLFDFSAGISLCTFSGAALATPIIRAILPLRTMR